MKVKVKDWGARYTTYYKWFEENNCTEYLEQYRQKESLIKHFDFFDEKCVPFDSNFKVMNTDNFIFEVIKQGVHTGEYMRGTELYLIQEPITNKVMLFDKKALEVVEQ